MNFRGLEITGLLEKSSKKYLPKAGLIMKGHCDEERLTCRIQILWRYTLSGHFDSVS